MSAFQLGQLVYSNQGVSGLNRVLSNSGLSPVERGLISAGLISSAIYNPYVAAASTAIAAYQTAQTIYGFFKG